MRNSYQFLALVLLLTVVRASGAPRSAAGHGRGAPRPEMSDAVWGAAVAAAADPSERPRLRRLLAAVRNPNAFDKQGNTALCYAARAGDVELVRSLIKRGADPNLKDTGGRAPLHCVSYFTEAGTAAVVEELIARGARPDDRDPTGTTPLMSACEVPNLRAALVLLSHGADAKARDSDGASVLAYAARHDAPELINALLRRGAQVNVANRLGETPLMQAVSGGASQTFHLLLARGARVTWGEKSSVPLIHVAVANGSISIVKTLIGRGANLNVRTDQGDTLLMSAAKHGDAELLGLLLGKGLDVNAARPDGTTPLMVAVEAGNREGAEVLLEHGADPNRQDKVGTTALGVARKAVLGVDEELIALLKKAGAKSPNVPLGDAVDYGDVDEVRAALGRGEDPNQIHKTDALGMLGSVLTGIPGMIGRDDKAGKAAADRAMKEFTERGAPLVFVAISKASDHPEILKLLLERGAKTDSRDPFGNTPLHAAAVGSSAEVVEALVKNGANLEARDQAGNTPLISAAFGRNVAGSKKLLELGADPKAKDTPGYSALDVALLSIIDDEPISGDLVTALVEKGADVNQHGVQGFTALLAVIMRPGGDPDETEAPAKPATALPAATQKAAEKLVEKLPEDAKAKLKQVGDKLVEALEAPRWSRYETIEFLLKHGADPNARAEKDLDVSSTVIISSIQRKKPQGRIMRLLVAHGMKLDQVGLAGMTPLAQAAAEGSLPLVGMVLAVGGDARSTVGLPPLVAGVMGKNPEVVRQLLKRGADANLVYDGFPVLAGAAGIGNLEIVQMLVAKGADVNRRGKGGASAVGVAAQEKHPAVVAYLKSRGAKK